MGFTGGSWAQNKVCFHSSAAAHVFSPLALLTLKEMFQVSSLRGSVLEACSFVFQPSREEGPEEKTEDNLTTLFPGQKRRISHLVKQGNVSATFRSRSEGFHPVTTLVQSQAQAGAYEVLVLGSIGVSFFLPPSDFWRMWLSFCDKQQQNSNKRS